MVLTFEIILILTLILINGLFSMSEMALIKAKKSRLKLLVKEGNKSAKDTLALVKNSPEMLSTIQVGITLVGIFTGVFSGATISKNLAEQISQISILEDYSMVISILFVVLIITYFTLILGELLPKQIGLSDPEKISMKATKPIQVFMKINRPLIRFLSASTRFFMKVFGIKPAKEEYITEDEVKILIAEGTQKGNFEKGEKRIIERVLYLGNLSIRRFITPKDKIIWFDVSDSLKTVQKKITQSDKSVFPVCDGGLDKILGAVEVKDILAWTCQKSKTFELINLLQPVSSISSRTPALIVIEKLRKSNLSIMLITGRNKHEIIGIVSFHDILEALVGTFKEGNS